MSATRYRKLRITLSVGWGVVAVLLCVLWVRSYWRHDSCAVALSSSRFVGLGSAHGALRAFGSDYKPDEWGKAVWVKESGAINNPSDHQIHASSRYYHALGFGIERFPTSLLIVWPYWFGVLLVGTFAIVPWIRQLRWKFSLRTLLIATTLAGVVLGLAVWAMKR